MRRERARWRRVGWRRGGRAAAGAFFVGGEGGKAASVRTSLRHGGCAFAAFSEIFEGLESDAAPTAATIRAAKALA